MIRGWASKAILDTYELERRPYSLELIEFDKNLEKLFRPEGLAPDEFAKCAIPPAPTLHSHIAAIAYGNASSCS